MIICPDTLEASLATLSAIGANFVTFDLGAPHQSSLTNFSPPAWLDS